jgi:hypothetical protein
MRVVCSVEIAAAAYGAKHRFVKCQLAGCRRRSHVQSLRGVGCKGNRAPPSKAPPAGRRGRQHGVDRGPVPPAAEQFGGVTILWRARRPPHGGQRPVLGQLAPRPLGESKHCLSNSALGPPARWGRPAARKVARKASGNLLQSRFRVE